LTAISEWNLAPLGLLWCLSSIAQGSAALRPGLSNFAPFWASIDPYRDPLIPLIPLPDFGRIVLENGFHRVDPLDPLA
jgi:hypothetical protein